jgi:hypothetical protein
MTSFSVYFCSTLIPRHPLRWTSLQLLSVPLQLDEIVERIGCPRALHDRVPACAALAASIAPPPAANFVTRAVQMLDSIGWIAAHRFLFADLRVHLLGWPAFLAPDGRVAALGPAAPPA